jgi:hypothetical protein
MKPELHGGDLDLFKGGGMDLQLCRFSSRGVMPIPSENSEQNCVEATSNVSRMHRAYLTPSLLKMNRAATPQAAAHESMKPYNLFILSLFTFS